VRRARANKLGLYGTSYGGSKGIQSPWLKSKDSKFNLL
jgi:hypothetical protein